MGQSIQKETGLNDKTIRPFGMRDKLGYLFGDFGNDFFFILSRGILNGILYRYIWNSPSTSRNIIHGCTIWDAFADITWGRFIDTRKATKNGKFRPWILRMSIPLVVVGVLMFVHIPGMSNGFYLAYAYVTYIIWGSLYSTVNIPYGSMASVITADPVERTSLSSWRTLGVTISWINY